MTPVVFRNFRSDQKSSEGLLAFCNCREAGHPYVRELNRELIRDLSVNFGDRLVSDFTRRQKRTDATMERHLGIMERRLCRAVVILHV